MSTTACTARSPELSVDAARITAYTKVGVVQSAHRVKSQCAQSSPSLRSRDGPVWQSGHSLQTVKADSRDSCARVPRIARRYGPSQLKGWAARRTAHCRSSHYSKHSPLRTLPSSRASGVSVLKECEPLGGARVRESGDSITITQRIHIV